MAQYPGAIQNNTSDLPNNKASNSTLSPAEWNSLVTSVVALENKVLDTASAPTGAGQVLTSIDADTATWQSPAQTGYYPGGTKVAVVDGGTGAGTAAAARTSLGSAASGANGDITSLTGLTTPLTTAQGGTGNTLGKAAPRVTSPTFSATLTPNIAAYDVIKVTLTGNVTIAAPTGTPYDGQSFRLELRQDTTGSRTVTWNSIYSFPGNTTPTISTTASYKDILPFVYDALTGTWELYGGPITFLAGK